jgi:hypothetical protein
MSMGTLLWLRWNHCIRRVAADGVTPPMFLSLLTPLLQSSFASDIQQHFLDTGSFHDVCFVVDGERVPAHRSHLYATCEYFRSRFDKLRVKGGR